MSQVSDRDVEAIKEWLAKESHLPNTFDDRILKKFLFSCHCSLEKTKKCIDEFCTKRANMPEIYTKRDTMSKPIQKVFSVTAVTTYLDGNTELLMHLLKEIPSDFDFMTCLKAFTTQVDNWVTIERDVLPEHQVIVIDIRAYTLKLMTQVNVFYFKDFVSLLLEGMPLRLKEVHFINCPSFYEFLFNIVKPAFPEWIIKLMHFHPNHEGLYKFVNKKSLPIEYGGEAESIEDQNAFWIKSIGEQRNFYLDDNLWKADLSQKAKNDKVDKSMSGSFKTLEID